MYIRFQVTWQHQATQLQQDIEAWCQRYEIRHAKKLIKNHLRVTFDQDQHYTLFGLTWQGEPFELVNINMY